MTATEAARELRKQIDAPLWAVSIAIMHAGASPVLIVRVDPSYRFLKNPPTNFGGYPVTVERRAPIRAQ